MSKVFLIDCSSENPTKYVAVAAKLCYSRNTIQELKDKAFVSEEEIERLVRNLLSMGHESPLEHVSFTFGIEGVSRSFLAQLTRHRIASYSVKSQRYVDEKGFDYVIPPAIMGNKSALAEFERCMKQCAQSYEYIASILDGGCKGEHKKAIEDARFVLPNACKTQLIVTMNARELRHFFKQRCCMRAQWEIREVAYKMFELVYEKASVLFENAGPSCVNGKCTEGKMSCGKYREARKQIERIKEKYNKETE